MKYLLSLLILSVTLMGCTSGDMKTIPDSDGLPESAKTSATATPDEIIVTPDPDGQILDNTKWILDHAIIDGEVQENLAYTGLEIWFSPEYAVNTVTTYDGCNRRWYENQDGGPSYVATENGDFYFPWGNVEFSMTAVGCQIGGVETGEVYDIGKPDFMPGFDEIVAYELQSDQLLLYYPETKQNVLVFQQQMIP